MPHALSAAGYDDCVKRRQIRFLSSSADRENPPIRIGMMRCDVQERKAICLYRCSSGARSLCLWTGCSPGMIHGPLMK